MLPNKPVVLTARLCFASLGTAPVSTPATRWAKRGKFLQSFNPLLHFMLDLCLRIC
jgi:hypothetical protein